MWPVVAMAGAQAASAGLSAWNSSNNIGMQRETNNLNYQMWQKQMDYDRPINQVARLKEAGLNPALMYGTGSGANTAPNPVRAEAPKGDYHLDPGAIVAVQQARLLGEQSRAIKMENDANDPSKGAPPGSRRTDSGPVRAAREFWHEAKNSGGDFVRGLKSYGNEFMNRHRTTFGDWMPKKGQGLFYGSDNGYKKPWNRRDK